MYLGSLGPVFEVVDNSHPDNVTIKDKEGKTLREKSDELQLCFDFFDSLVAKIQESNDKSTIKNYLKQAYEAGRLFGYGQVK